MDVCPNNKEAKDFMQQSLLYVATAGSEWKWIKGQKKGRCCRPVTYSLDLNTSTNITFLIFLSFSAGQHVSSQWEGFPWCLWQCVAMGGRSLQWLPRQRDTPSLRWLLFTHFWRPSQYHPRKDFIITLIFTWFDVLFGCHFCLIWYIFICILYGAFPFALDFDTFSFLLDLINIYFCLHVPDLIKVNFYLI